MADIEQGRPEIAGEDIQLQDNAATKDQAQERGDETHDAFLVTFGPNDPENPKNWSMKIKWGVTIALSATGFNRIMVSTVSHHYATRRSYRCLPSRFVYEHNRR